MKKYLFFFLCLLLIVACQQKKKPLASKDACCKINATAAFASFTKDKAFVMKHENPLSIDHTDLGKMVSFKGSDGKEAKAYELRAKVKSDKYLFVIHEWWGLNDHIKKEAEKFFNDLGNVNILAIDLYDSKVATTREDAAKYMQSVKIERAKAIIEGAIKYAGKKAKFGTVGWCFGGGWSLQSALLAGDKAKACIIYYGMPEKDKEKLKTLKAPVLGIFASQEQWISPAIVSEFENNMKELGKNITLKNYDAEHAFANPSNPKYNKEFAEDAYKNSLEFLKNNLK